MWAVSLRMDRLKLLRMKQLQCNYTMCSSELPADGVHEPAKIAMYQDYSDLSEACCQVGPKSLIIVFYTVKSWACLDTWPLRLQMRLVRACFSLLDGVTRLCNPNMVSKMEHFWNSVATKTGLWCIGDNLFKAYTASVCRHLYVHSISLQTSLCL
jgi:hypothetical protein